jgi:hypothetical protein
MRQEEKEMIREHRKEDTGIDNKTMIITINLALESKPLGNYIKGVINSLY